MKRLLLFLALIGISPAIYLAKADPVPAPVVPVPVAPVVPVVPAQPKPLIAIEQHVSAEVGDFVIVHATTDGTIVQWSKPESGLSLLPGELVRVDKALVLMAKKSGHYTIQAYSAVIINGVATPTNLAQCNIDIAGPTPPPPPPGPPPGPGPGPGPVSSTVWVVAVQDATATTQSQAKILDSKTLWDKVESAGNQSLIVDKNSKEASDGKYNDYIQKAVVGYPALLFLKPDGTFIKAIKLPADEAGVLSEVSKVTGK